MTIDSDLDEEIRAGLRAHGLSEDDVDELMDFANREVDAHRLAHAGVPGEGIFVLNLDEVVEELGECYRALDLERLSKTLFKLALKAKDTPTIEALAREVLEAQSPDVQKWWTGICDCGAALGPHRH